jgi:putative ubiquitin-RnfH superfamily antitoxin RatB of RatAB toxin-antitoxin module
MLKFLLIELALCHDGVDHTWVIVPNAISVKTLLDLCHKMYTQETWFGIWGKRITLTHILYHDTRVESYRPIMLIPNLC